MGLIGMKGIVRKEVLTDPDRSATKRQESVSSAKCHGLSLEEVEGVFTGEPAVMMNTRHDSDEERFQAVGVTAEGKYAFVVFTFRKEADRTLIRPISARYMHQKEIEHYEKQKKT